MAKLKRRLVYFWMWPRLYVTAISTGVFVGSAVSIFFERIDFVAAPFGWVGCLIVLRLVWSSDPTWSQVFRSTAFWIGLALVVAGNLIMYARTS
jgi:hypothetical protein